MENRWGVSPPQELAWARWWGNVALLGQALPEPVIGPGLEVRQQTYGTFRVNQSVWEGPLRIGKHVYPRGLGTHSSSEVRVLLPGAGKRFSAAVGIDHNPTTFGGQGSAVLVVEVAGGEAFRSEVLRGGGEAVEAQAELDQAQEFLLRVLDGGDGPACDQVDWAEAQVEMADGRRIYLDELPILRGPSAPSAQLPFSFTYGGRRSEELLLDWTRRVEAEAEGEVSQVIYQDPDAGLQVTCTVRQFPDFPAVDWVLEFANEGSGDSLLLEQVRPLDLQVNTPPGEWMQLHSARGSTCEITDFLPLEQTLKPEERVELAPVGGRSSNGTLPFFNVAWGHGGVMVGIGWSGQWAASVHRETPQTLRLQAGQQTFRARLRPGERIRTPRLLLVFWQGRERLRGHHLLRQLLLAHYCPRINGELALPPVAHPTSATILADGKPANEENQLEMLRAAADLGVEAFWLDAYWFPQGFPGGVGTWAPRPEDFPRGLRPLSNAAHAAGMKFILWFEPERVAPGSQIAREHPEFCFAVGEGDWVYNLGNPAAREFMTELLARSIEEYGVDIYREDFNIDPLPFWQAADEPDRQGLAEVGFVEGLYAMWDALRERFPHLAIDNCASGGRRIDLETVSRSYALWRSDFQDVGLLNLPDFLDVAAIANQVQTVGLGLYVPLHTAALWSFDPYSFRSAMTTGVPAYLDLRSPDLDRPQARAAIAELKRLRPYFLGDLYPLLPLTTSPTDWCAYQFHRPDLDAGIALFFRRHQSPYATLEGSLQAIDPNARYQWAQREDYREPIWRTTSGSELAHLRISIDQKPGAVLLQYRQRK